MKILLFSFGFLVLCSCWSPFPNAYERSMQVGRFRPNINTGIAKKVNILKSATKPLNVLIAFTRPLITEFADNLNLKHPLLPTISPYPTM